MSDNGDYVERTVDPVSGRTTETRVVRRSNTGLWVALAIIAVVVVGGIFWMMSANQNSQADLQAARDQGAAQAQLDAAGANAQAAAAQAGQSAQSAMSGAAQATQGAAQAAADRASSAADAARDAAATPPPAPPSPPQ